MNKVISVYKPVGITPFALIQQLKHEMPEVKDQKIGYAGRLDPMAHGLMLLMVGDAAKERDEYLSLQKEYEFEVLLGVETDTYDVLGLIASINCHSREDGKPVNQKNASFIDPDSIGVDWIPDQVRDDGSSGEKDKDSIVNEKVNLFVKNHLGKQLQSYPPYSSKPVAGKPLFWWARNDKLHEITIPQKEITIETFELLSSGFIMKKDLQKTIDKNVSNIVGDFRQQEIKESWNEFFSVSKNESFPIMRFRINCSSGTYVRGLVSELGKSLGCGAVATEILRTCVGEYTLEDAVKF